MAPAVALGFVDLKEHFAWQQVSHESRDGACAEAAAHSAADLRGNTQAVAVLVFHKYCFDRLAVGQPIKIFYRIIQCRYKLFFDN